MVNRGRRKSKDFEVRFLSANTHKIAEVEQILQPKGIRPLAVNQKIDEIQTHDVDALLRDKAIKAFRAIGRPLFVEQTGLYTRALNELPAGLTQVFWDSLLADKFSALFAALGDCTVTAKTHIAYIDGRHIHTFSGVVEGQVAPEPRGSRDFQWDCVFIPNGHDRTFGEMSPEEKNEISMRRRALDEFAAGISKYV